MKVIIHKYAEKELKQFPLDVQDIFNGYFLLFEHHGKINPPQGKEIYNNKELREIIISIKYEYHLIYFQKGSIYVLTAFKDKLREKYHNRKRAYERLSLNSNSNF